MDSKKRRIVFAVLLIISIGNYTKIIGTENIRTVEFLSIFVIGSITALLIREIVLMLKNK
jgi:hypothetical protein